MYLADLDDPLADPKPIETLRLVPQGASFMSHYGKETSCFIMGGMRDKLSIPDVFNITTEGVITDKAPMMFARAYFALAK